MSSANTKRKRDEGEGSLLKDEVEFSRLDTPFPRGGGSELAPIEIKRAAAEATNDVFDQMMKAKKQRRGKAKPEVTAKPQRTRIEPLKLSSIKVGTLILGQITDINFSNSELIVSLPNNLIGYCPTKSLSQNRIGRFLRFVVTDVGEASKRRLVLSDDPELVNQCIDSNELTKGLAVQGVIESVEEKGVVLNLGSELGKGFLPMSTKQLADYQENETILAFVKDPERRIKPLTLDSSFAAITVISQPSLVPGTLIKSVPIQSTNSMGCVYDLFGHIPATSDAVHSRNEETAVRVLFSYPPTQINGDRQLGVSRLPHVVHLESKVPDITVGKVVTTSVLKILPSLGLLMDIENGAAQGFAHISQIEGSKEVDLEEDQKYNVGSKHKGRITGYSTLDDVAYVSLDEEVINQKYMSITDVKIGDVVQRAVVDRVLIKGGVLVTLSKGIVGIANALQLTDVAMRNPETKFKPGQQVAARVLNVDLENERVELSLKKSIVDFEGPILDNYTTLNGNESIGTVIRILDSGVKMLFFGGVKGLLPLAQMSETGAKADELVKLGQSMRVHVLEADASRDRLIVSTRPVSNLGEHIGETLEAIVSSRNKHEVRVSLLPDLGEATLVGEVVNAETGQKLKVDERIKVQVISERLATNDPKLMASRMPKDVDELEVGQQLEGFVAGSQANTGLFVGFSAGLVGMVPANLMGSKSWPAIGKAVSVMVDTIDFARKRLFLSLPSAARTIDATITAVKATQLNVTTDDGRQGRVEISQIFKSIDEIADRKHPLATFKTGQKLKELYIVGRHDARNHRFLPLSHRTGTNLVLELALHPPSNQPAGSKSLAFVNNYSEDHRTLWVSLSPTTRGQLSVVDLTNSAEELKEPEKFYPVGSALEVTVLKRDSKVALTALSGPSTYALVFSVTPLKLMVRLPYHRTKAIACVDTGDTFKKLKAAFKVGDIVEFNKDVCSYETLRNTPHTPVEEGQIRQGFVCNVAEGGVFVALAPNVIGRVQISQLSDTYLKDWKSYLRVGDVVEAKVLSVSSSSNGKIELSLRQSAITGKKQQNVSNVEVNRNYNGTVCRVETFGVFIDFKGVRGLCHISEISDHPIDDLSRVFRVGDDVRVKVLRKDESNGKLSLGMKAKYFENEDENDSHTSDEEENEMAASNSEDDSDDALSVAASPNSSQQFGSDMEQYSSDSESSGIDSVRDDDKVNSSIEMHSSKSSKPLSAGFNWNGEISDYRNSRPGSDSDESDSDEDEPRQKRRKKRESFVQDETAAIQTRLPQSAKDFERLIVATPHSSIIWMNYMAFELQLGEIDGAREIAKRALKTIPQSDEQERMNVWVALLNLEAQFGNSESTEKTFREAQQYMDSLTIHLKMASVYAQAGKPKNAAEIYKRAHKRFGGQSMEPWLAEMRYYFTNGYDKNAGRKLADDALQRLPSRMHRDFTRQFALLEFELGDAERGRTLFEALLSSAPKRVDIWNIYLDQEIKAGSDAAKIGALFDRVLQQRITMKQAKFFFKKWMDVATDQEYVKMRAREYVENRESVNRFEKLNSAESGDSSGSDSN